MENTLGLVICDVIFVGIDASNLIIIINLINQG